MNEITQFLLNIFISFRPYTAKTNSAQGSADIVNGPEPLAMQGIGKSHFPIPPRKRPMNGRFRMRASLMLSIAVIAHFNRALFEMLRRLCPTEQHAWFWQAYARILLCVLPLFIVLIFDIRMQLAGLQHIKMVLATVLAGLLVGLSFLGVKIYRPALQQSRSLSQTQIQGE